MLNRKDPHSQSGFSLLELIIVVTLIAIFSAVLLQKYFEMRHAANILVLQGTQLSLQGAANLTYSKSLSAGTDNQLSGMVTIHSAHPLAADNNSNPFALATRYGYPQGRWSELSKVVELDNHKWSYSNQFSGAIEELVLWTTAGPGSIKQCNIHYQGAPAAGYPPQITINKSGC